LSSVFFESTTLRQAGYDGSFLFSRFFNQKFGPAQRAFTIDGFVPGSEGALRETVAAIKNFASLGGAFDNISAAIFLGTGYSDLFAVAV
jgi:hypothetical protein